jgi:hypothetical protein
MSTEILEGHVTSLVRVELPEKGLMAWRIRYMRGGKQFRVLFHDKHYGSRDASRSAAEAAIQRISSDREESRSLSRKA